MLFRIIHDSLVGLLMFENATDFIYSPFIQLKLYCLL